MYCYFVLNCSFVFNLRKTSTGERIGNDKLKIFCVFALNRDFNG